MALIDSIPTSLLRPSATSTTTAHNNTSIDMFNEHQDPFSPLHPHGQGEGHNADNSTMHANALSLIATTRLGFLARYRDFHALYASGERRAAAELLVLLMSSNAAPKRFWAVMLLDSVALLNCEYPSLSRWIEFTCVFALSTSLTFVLVGPPQPKKSSFLNRTHLSS